MPVWLRARSTRPECFVFLYQVKIHTRINTFNTRTRRNRGVLRLTKTTLLQEIRWVPTPMWLWFPICARNNQYEIHQTQGEGFTALNLINNIAEVPFKTMRKCKTCLIFCVPCFSCLQWALVKWLTSLSQEERMSLCSERRQTWEEIEELFS